MLTFNDLAFAAKAYAGCDVRELDRICSALKAPFEIRSGSVKQCIRFLKLHTELDDYPALEQYKEQIDSGECSGHYCIAMGLFIKETGVDLSEALELYCYSILSSMANHAVKLVPLRQLDGRRHCMTLKRKSRMRSDGRWRWRWMSLELPDAGLIYVPCSMKTYFRDYIFHKEN